MDKNCWNLKMNLNNHIMNVQHFLWNMILFEISDIINKNPTKFRKYFTKSTCIYINDNPL